MSAQSGKSPSRIFYELSSHFGEPESEIFPRILEKLVSQEEAEILLCLPGTSEEVAEKTRIQVAKVTEVLEDLFMRGLVVRTSAEGGKIGYALCGNLLDSIFWEIGARNARGERLDATDWEVFDLFDKHGTARIIEDPPREPIFRVVPVEKAIPIETEVLPYEVISNLVKEAEIISVAQCPCRLAQEMRGRKCDNPLETCIQTGEPAKINLERGVARKITAEEALEILKRCEDLGLVHQTGNTAYGLDAICNCCPCCCDFLRGLMLLGAKNATAKSRYHAIVDEDLCTGCGVCETRCNFGAMKIEDGMAHSDPGKCFGCGLCVSKCPTQAISLVLDKEEKHIPVEEGWGVLPALPAHDVLLKALKDYGRRGVQSPI